MENSEFLPVLYNIKNGESYQYLGLDKYRNIRTLVEGIIAPETAKKYLLFDVNASQMLNEFPLITEMANRLNLKITR